MHDGDDLPGEPRHVDDAVSLRAALEHVCRHDARAIVLVRVGIGPGGLEAVITSCGPDGISEDRDMRIMRAILPELTDLGRAIRGKRAAHAEEADDA